MSTQLDLIQIALKDITAAEALYNKKLYAQSYYYFQQASEKANKAWGLFSEIISEDELKHKVQHKQLRIFKQGVIKEEKEVNTFLKIIQSNPEAASHQYIVSKPFEVHHNNLKEGIKFHETVNNQNFDRKEDLNSFLDAIDELYEIRIRPSKRANEAVLKECGDLVDFATKFFTEDKKQEVLEGLRNTPESELLKYNYKVVTYQVSALYIQFTFYFCALITTNHNNTTRYPENNVSPLTKYTRKNILVEYQPYFLRYLKIASQRLKKMIINYEKRSKSDLRANPQTFQDDSVKAP